MASFLSILTGFLAFAALAGIVVYIFGIPPEIKRKMERAALKTMGENKTSYMLQSQISKIPDSDQRDIKDLKKGLGNALGGATKNPVGEEAGELADTLTSPFTGR